jgi:hypothetical protein
VLVLSNSIGLNPSCPCAAVNALCCRNICMTRLGVYWLFPAGCSRSCKALMVQGLVWFHALAGPNVQHGHICQFWKHL